MGSTASSSSPSSNDDNDRLLHWLDEHLYLALAYRVIFLLLFAILSLVFLWRFIYMLKRTTAAVAAKKRHLAASRYAAYGNADGHSSGTSGGGGHGYHHSQQAAGSPPSLNGPPSTSGHVSTSNAPTTPGGGNGSGSGNNNITSPGSASMTAPPLSASAAAANAAAAAVAAATTGMSPASISHISSNNDNHNNTNGTASTATINGNGSNGIADVTLPSPGVTPTAATVSSLSSDPTTAAVTTSSVITITAADDLSASQHHPVHGNHGVVNGDHITYIIPEHQYHTQLVDDVSPAIAAASISTMNNTSNHTNGHSNSSNNTPFGPCTSPRVGVHGTSYGNNAIMTPPYLPHHSSIMNAAPLAFGVPLPPPAAAAAAAAVTLHHMPMNLAVMSRMETPSPRPHSPRPISPRPLTPPLSGRITAQGQHSSNGALSPRSPTHHGGNKGSLINVASWAAGGHSTISSGYNNNGGTGGSSTATRATSRRTRSGMANHQLTILLLYGFAAITRTMLAVDPMGESVYSPWSVIILSIFGSVFYLLAGSTVVSLFIYVNSIFGSATRTLILAVRIMIGVIVILFLSTLIVFAVYGTSSPTAWHMHNGILCAIYFTSFFISSHFMIPILKCLGEVTDQPKLMNRIIFCTRVSQGCCIIVAAAYLSTLVGPEFVHNYMLQVVSGIVIRFTECMLSAVTVIFAGRPIVLSPARASNPIITGTGLTNHGIAVWQPAESVALHGSAAATVSAAAPGTVYVKVSPMKQPEFMCFDAGGRPFGQPLSIIAEEESHCRTSALGRNGPSRSEHRRLSDINGGHSISGISSGPHSSGSHLLPRSSSDVLATNNMNGGNGNGNGNGVTSSSTSAVNSLIIPTSVVVAAANVLAAASQSPSAAAAAAAAGVAAAVSGYTPPTGRSRSSSLDHLFGGGSNGLMLASAVTPSSASVGGSNNESSPLAPIRTARGSSSFNPRGSNSNGNTSNNGSTNGSSNQAAAAALAAAIAATASATPTTANSGSLASSGSTTPRKIKRPLSLDMAVVTSGPSATAMATATLAANNNSIIVGNYHSNSNSVSGTPSLVPSLAPKWMRSAGMIDDPPALHLAASGDSSSPHSPPLCYDGNDISSIFNGTHMMMMDSDQPSTADRNDVSSRHFITTEPCSPGGAIATTTYNPGSNPTSSRSGMASNSNGHSSNGSNGGGSTSSESGSPAIMMALSSPVHPLAVPSPRPLSSRATSMQLSSDTMMMIVDHLPGQLSSLPVPHHHTHHSISSNSMSISIGGNTSSNGHGHPLNNNSMSHITINHLGVAVTSLPSPSLPSTSRGGGGGVSGNHTVAEKNLSMAHHMHHERAASDVEMELSMDTLHMPAMVESLLQPPH